MKGKGRGRGYELKLITSVPVNKYIYGGGSPVGVVTCPGTASVNTIYVDTLYGSPTRGMMWICDGSGWQTHNPPPSTEWMFAGGTNDAGGNKDQAIYRNAPVAIGTSIPIVAADPLYPVKFQVNGTAVIGSVSDVNILNYRYGNSPTDCLIFGSSPNSTYGRPDAFVEIQRSGAGFPNMFISRNGNLSSASTTTAFLLFGINGASVGSVAYTGTATAFNTTSDARLKENIVPTHFGISDLMNVNVVDFNFKSDSTKTKTTGFIAQDLYNVYPQAVSVGGANANENPWGVDYGKITPLLVKAIQEQQAEIEALKARLAALENK